MSEKAPVSVVVITKNEERNIVDCLESAKWADEIVVLDDCSTDKTVELAKKYTDKVYQRKMDIEGRHRNYAYSLAKNKWVLSVDADERITSELAQEIKEVLKNGTDCNGFTIPIKTYIGDYWVRYGGWYPGAKLRFFKKDAFKYEEVEVHPRAFMEDPRGCLKSDLLHYSFKDFSDFLRKLDNLTTLEAIKWYKTNKKVGLGKALWRTFDRFWRSYFSKKGRKDGLIGFMFAVFAGLYQILSYAKYWELKNGKTTINK